MSAIKDTGFKRPECGNIGAGNIRDIGGGIVNLQVVGTDPNIGVKAGSSITSGTGDYSPPADNKNTDSTFLILIEAEGIFFVTLVDGSDFLITSVQSTAYLGQWYPAKIYSVNVGTTGSFSVGY